jgi:hypothetical protein
VRIANPGIGFAAGLTYYFQLHFLIFKPLESCQIPRFGRYLESEQAALVLHLHASVVEEEQSHAKNRHHNSSP